MYDISHGVLQYVICVAKIDLELRIAKFAQSELFLTRGEITRISAFGACHSRDLLLAYT